MGMDDDTRLGLCSDCGYKIQFMASVEGQEGHCPKCGSLQLLIPYSKTPTDTPFTEKETTPLISTDDGESKQLKVKEDSSILFIPFVRGYLPPCQISLSITAEEQAVFRPQA